MAPRKKTHLARACLLIATTVFASACGGDGTDPPAPSKATGPSTGSVCPDVQTLTYENFGMDFFSSYCTGCHSDHTPDGSRHSAPIGYNWDEIDSVRAHAMQIDKAAAAGPAAVNTFMPPKAPRPTEDERRELGEWLACGAP